ncbi:MAG: hypothetical protein U0T79_05115 [Ferruginibacter sp.]
MIKSQYILDILDLAIDNLPERDLLRNQIALLAITDINHTGVGVFINFSPEEEIQKFKIDTSNSRTFDTDGNAIALLDGVEIRNAELSILADAIVHLKNGIIDHLEIWNKSGADYVLTEPEHYQLEQMWLEATMRRRIIK